MMAIAQWYSVVLVIVKLLTPGSIPKLAIRRWILGKCTYCLFRIGAKKSTRCGGPAGQKTSKQNPIKRVLYVGVVRQT